MVTAPAARRKADRASEPVRAPPHKVKWTLYRAVDQHGQAIDFLLRRDRRNAAVQAFLRKA